MSGQKWAPPQVILTEQWLLSELHSELAPDVARAEGSLFDRLAGDRELVLFGAGNLGRRTLAGLRNVGVEPIAFVDNAPALQGTLIDGVPVLSPVEAARLHATSAAFVVTIWTPVGRLAYPNVERQMSNLGCTTIVPFAPLFWKYAGEFLPNFCLDRPHLMFRDAGDILASYRLLADEISRREYLAQLSYLLSAQDKVEILGEPEPEWYFPRDLISIGPNEVFIDCGAYDGDTVEHFLRAAGEGFGSIVGYEPDPVAFAKLTGLVQQLPASVRERVDVRRKAVSDAPGWLRFDGGGTPGSHLAENGDIAVESVTLGEDLGLVQPTLIKMDIEGAEVAALRGAADVIRRSRPILAICIYHRQDHLYRIPLQMAGMCPNYRFFVRRQGPDGDLVCFAIPNERDMRLGA